MVNIVYRENDMDIHGKKALFGSEVIAGRVKEMGKEISSRHTQGGLVIIGVLKGAFIFMADLIRALEVDCEVDFVRISSYGSSSTSKGSLDITMDIRIPIKDRNVILVDDIVDTGLTLSQYKAELLKRGPKTVEVAALLNKTARREKEVNLDYCGFTIHDGFVVGYGLDFNEEFRQYGCIYTLDE
jgi:hypoxanthine phosphoribosyltransferase